MHDTFFFQTESPNEQADAVCRQKSKVPFANEWYGGLIFITFGKQAYLNSYLTISGFKV